MRRLLLAAAISALPAGAGGYDLIGTHSTWDAGTIRIEIKLGRTPRLADGSDYASSAQAAMAVWNTHLQNVQLSGQIVGAGPAGNGNGVNELAMDSTVYGEPFGANTLAVTTYGGVDERGDGTYRIVESDITFNNGVPWDSYRGDLRVAADIRRVAVHELGHLLGLDHPDEDKQNVAAIMNRYIGSIETPLPDDVTGVQLLYGLPPGTPRPANDRFADAPLLTFSGDIQVNGSSINATKEPGEPNHAPDEPGGASVWWKFVAPGNGVVTATTTGSNFDTLLAAYTGTAVDSLTQLAGNDDESPEPNHVRRSRISFAVTLGTTYHVAVDGWSGEWGLGVLNLDFEGSTPPVLGEQPFSIEVIEGDPARFAVSASGRPTPQFRWQRQAAAGGDWADVAGPGYDGATGTVLVVTSTLAMNGDRFRCVASNVAGSVTSREVTLTVKPLVPPTIGRVSPGTTVDYGGSLYLSVNVGGTPPLTFQWHRDGVPIPQANQSAYYDDFVTGSEAGNYSLVASNRGGVTTSPAIAVKVNPPVPPVITIQPATLTVNKGNSAGLWISTVGTLPMSYQWFRDGKPVAGATHSQYAIDAAIEAHSGRYTVVVTNLAGQATSTPADLVVMPPALPTFVVGSGVIRLDRTYPRLDLYSGATTTLPASYQWFKDGVPIPGETSNRLFRTGLTFADAGAYSVRVTNEAGVAMSPEVTVMWSNESPWLDVDRIGDVVYFLAASPGRIHRYDLSTESWLPIVYLTENKAPTAFLATASGTLIAYGKELAWRGADLREESVFATSQTSVENLAQVGDFAYFAESTTVRSLRLSDRSPGPAYSLLWDAAHTFGHRVRPATVGGRRMLVGASGYSPRDVVRITMGTDGAITEVRDSPYHGSFQVADGMHVSPDERAVFDRAGVIYNLADLTYRGSLGLPFDDLVFTANGDPVVVRGARLSLADARTGEERGGYALAAPANHLQLRAESVYAFGAATGGGANPTVSRVPLAAFAPVPIGAAADPVGRAFSIEETFMDARGVVHFVSRSLRGVARWDSRNRTFLPTLPLRGSPVVSAYLPQSDRLVMVLGDGTATSIDLGAAPVERAWASLSVYHELSGLVPMTDQVLVDIGGGQTSSEHRLILGMDGATRHLSGSDHWPLSVTWQAATNRLYSYSYSPGQPHGTFHNFPLAPSGIPPATSESQLAGMLTPLRFTTAGDMAVSGTGLIVNAVLAQLGRLDNAVHDAAWTADAIYTIRGRPENTELQKWARVTYAAAGSLSLPGAPIRIFRLDDANLVVVTRVDGHLAFHLVPSNLGKPASQFNLPGALVVPTFTTQPASLAATHGGAGIFTAVAVGSGPIRYQWEVSAAGWPAWYPVVDDAIHRGANSGTLSVSAWLSASGNTYRCIAVNSAGRATSQAATFGVLTAAGITGAGSMAGTNIAHQNGNIYDQVLLDGDVVSVRADAGQVVRTSFIDLSDDIVQVEFAGAGTLTITLEPGATGPAAPANYNQAVTYMRGHARIVVAGADETTNLSVFSVGRMTAFDPTGGFDPTRPASGTNDPAKNANPIFKAGTTYDGMADLASISILSSNGRFGGLRTSNASYFATTGLTGIYAPGVEFTGPVFIGDLSAADAAQPVLLLGSAGDVRVTGGSLQQLNGAPVAISGITQLKFTAGVDSHGRALPAQQNRARLERDGVDVTTTVVVNPGP